MSNDAYPKREPFFANRYCRLLAKTCAAQEIGHAAFALCVTVAHVEDAKRYRGPVTFHCEQLMPIIGVAKWETLDNARKRAINAGWLYYEAGNRGRRQPGRYWVTIPVDASGLDDSPCDEGEPLSSAVRGESQSPIQSPVKGDWDTSQYPAKGDRDGDRDGDPSSLPLFPIPKEESSDGDGRLVRKKPKAKGFDPDNVEMPPELGEVFRPEWIDWCNHRREIGEPLTETSVSRQLKMLAGFGLDLARRSIDESIRGQWRGLFPPKGPDSRPPRHTLPASADGPSLIDKIIGEPT